MIFDAFGAAAPDQKTPEDRRAERRILDYITFGYVPLEHRDEPGWPRTPGRD